MFANPTVNKGFLKQCVKLGWSLKLHRARRRMMNAWPNNENFFLSFLCAFMYVNVYIDYLNFRIS